MPSLPPISAYHFNFESREVSSPRAGVARDSTDPSLELELTVGAWFLTVTALAETGSGLKEIARGSANLLVLADLAIAVTVQLTNEPGDGPGTLRYTVEFPNSVTAAFLSLSSIDGGDDPDPVDLLAGSSESGSVITNTGALNAAAGNYFLNIDLYGSAGNAGKTEVVHIYSNTETEAPLAKYTFSSGAFSPTTEYQTGSQSLYEALTDIGVASGADFTIMLNQDEPDFAPYTLTTALFGGKKLRIRGQGHRITLDGTGSLFTLETGAVLVVQDLELHGQGPEIDNTGALIRVTGGDLLLNPGTVITKNNSPSSSGSGVSVESGTFIMRGGTISDNSSSYGGVYVGGTFTMSGGTISGNSSSGGGGVVVQNSGIFTISGGTISNNLVRGVLVDGTFTMSGGTIADNSSSNGGGVYVQSNGTYTMSGGTIADNFGGGVYVQGTFTMSGGTISGNSSGGGGGVSVRDNGTFAMSGGTIASNSSSSGGGVFVSDNSTFTMSGGTISGNSSSGLNPHDGGGGVHLAGTFIMNGGTISGNYSSPSSTYSYGGGVHIGNGTFTMNGGAISDNFSYDYGGGVFVSGTFAMNDGTISDNSSYYGSGVFVSGTFTMGNNTRIDPSNEVCLDYAGGNSSITLAGGFSGSDTIAVIDLGGGAADWLGKPVLARDAGYTGTIPADRFTLGNFVTYNSKTPITNYIINSEGKLMNE
jgi:hypothetical protein